MAEAIKETGVWERLARPLGKFEVGWMLFIFLGVAVYPRIELMRTQKSNKLVTHVSEGVVAFVNAGKRGYLTLIDGKPYTCALMALRSNSCNYRLATSKEDGSTNVRQAMIGRHATVRWAESQSLGLGGGSRVVVSLVIDGHAYRTSMDYDRVLFISRRTNTRMTVVLSVLFLLYFGVRVIARLKFTNNK